ncbi:hypothetical protein BD310DRAFT_864379 [Dichomitus squalens]|uniref:RRN6 K-rich C-terminal domain-containing protein n=1 Tax=Dichomitus squalens TaxID=114155 RepID=A0A4V2K9X4_9APHY|nr:hypothetical protein BD310DRAFT_864379 [Dichomitus squalens]
MDVWPGNCHEQAGTALEKKGKGKAKDKRVEEPWRYPSLDHGTIGAASLRKAHYKSRKHYSWTFAAEASFEFKLVPSDAPHEVFPPTRPKPLHAPKLTLPQRAEQGAQFLRTYYPDVEIPGWLIRDEITDDARINWAFKQHDPFAGNMVDVTSFHVAKKDYAYLTFPMGETRCQLNMSPLVVHSKTKVELKATATPIHTFDTPIQQILASPHTDEVGKSKTAPMLGVRTMGHVTFMRVKVARTTHTIEIEPLITVQRADIGDRRAVDLTFFPLNTAVGYVANEVGSVFRCRASESSTIVEQVRIADSSQPVFCRIAAHETREKVAAILDAKAAMLDLRAGKQSYDLFTAPRPGVKLTSIEMPSDEDHMVRLASTDEILWLDERYMQRPLFAVKHGREFDLTLRTQTHDLTHSPLTFLTSRRNSLVTVYDVSRDSENLVHMYGSPYALPPLVRPDGPHSGFAFYQQPSLVGSKHISLLQLSERGGLSLLNLDHISADATPPETSIEHRRYQWTPEVHQLGKEADAKRIGGGPLAGRVHSVVDMRPAYQRLFMIRKDKSLTMQSNAVDDTLEQMPRYWQDPGAPTEHVLTTFDVAIRAGDEPTDVSRNDWFTGSSLDSAAGYRALQKGRIPKEQLARRAPWHLEISPFIRRKVPEFDKDPQTTMENLARYDVADDPRRPAESYRRETEARSQLALDLSLACDVYSTNRPSRHVLAPPNGSANLDDDMLSISLSTQAMSLGELEPPPVQFGFLRPIRKVPQWDDSKDADGEVRHENEGIARLGTPLGVRLLLQEWEVGTDPYEYVYRDPYDDSAAEPATAPRRLAKEPAGKEPPEQSRVPPQVHTQRPPAVASSVHHGPPAIASSQPVSTRRPLMAARSEDALAPRRPPTTGSQPADPWTAPPSSQDVPFASTQVLPGPHGGRSTVARKKPGKKRLGGF